MWSKGEGVFANFNFLRKDVCMLYACLTATACVWVCVCVCVRRVLVQDVDIHKIFWIVQMFLSLPLSVSV